MCYPEDKSVSNWNKNFGFIKQVDKGLITTVKDLESWLFEGYSFIILLWRRANAQNFSSLNLYQLIW